MNTKEHQWITKAVQLLKRLEIAGTDVSYDDDYSDYDNYSRDPQINDCCPCCGCIGDHYDDCELNRLLKEAKDIDGNQ